MYHVRLTANVAMDFLVIWVILHNLSVPKYHVLSAVLQISLPMSVVIISEILPLKSWYNALVQRKYDCVLLFEPEEILYPRFSFGIIFLLVLFISTISFCKSPWYLLLSALHFSMV